MNLEQSELRGMVPESELRALGLCAIAVSGYVIRAPDPVFKRCCQRCAFVFFSERSHLRYCPTCREVKREQKRCRGVERQRLKQRLKVAARTVHPAPPPRIEKRKMRVVVETPVQKHARLAREIEEMTAQMRRERALTGSLGGCCFDFSDCLCRPMFQKRLLHFGQIEGSSSVRGNHCHPHFLHSHNFRAIPDSLRYFRR